MDDKLRRSMKVVLVCGSMYRKYEYVANILEMKNT